MRVKFGSSIYLCTSVSHIKESKLLLCTTSNGVYTVEMLTCEQADKAYGDLLINGYCDASGCKYCN
ncbi:hypothetical protein GC105_10610 [Alkalibaculum sp. M08DMB]|uniref:Uncharacterized protein n=1 Tax=Alkalibaculum sporogenes TaxID=2655001 RepID=A0A6A7K9N0_9FIRM|nr:hypothetical protein [Alkalibaculum sporogenes]MPW26239.1 hypothetical protein [Alkalibaculum sporogenes]